MLELSHKNFKAAIITILNEITVNTLETIGKAYVLREIGIIKKDVENLEQKYSIRNLKKHTQISSHGLNCRTDMVEEKSQ